MWPHNMILMKTRDLLHLTAIAFSCLKKCSFLLNANQFNLAKFTFEKPILVTYQEFQSL